MAYAIATATATTAGTPPVAQAITVDCKGQTPKAVIVLASRATALNTITAGAMHSIGITDGTTTRHQASMAEDATLAASADTGVGAGTPLIRVLDTASETVDGEADFVSFAADTLNISWTNLPSTAIQIEVIAFYGQNLQAAVGVLTLNLTLNATTTASGLPFRPAGLFHLGSYGNFGAAGNGAMGRMSCGFAAFNTDGTVQGQAAYTAREADRATPTACISAILDDATAIRSTISAEDGKFSVTSGTSDGFVVTCLSNPAQAYAFGYLALFTGRRISVGVVQPSTSSTGNKTISSIGGKADFVMAIGTGLSTKNTYATTEPCANWSLGGDILDGAMGSIAFSDSDAAVTSESHCATSDASLVGVIVGATTDWAATFAASAFESSYGANDGAFTLNVSAASPADRYLAYMAFEAPPSPGWIDARSGHRWRRCLARR